MPKITEQDLLDSIAASYPQDLTEGDITAEMLSRKKNISMASAYRHLNKLASQGKLVKVECYDRQRHRLTNAYRKK